MSQSNHQNMETEILFDPNSEPQDARLAQLKQLFPDCFDKNGVFLAEKMAQALRTSDIDTSKEYYTMNWLGKSYAKVLRDLPPETFLAENNEHNSKSEHKNSQNLLIKGDNLEVLKHLTNAYKGAVKMIYIDPPYNTGKDGFVYQDDRKFTAEQLAKLGGMDLDEAQRVLGFTAKKSNSHSAWLTFMYPRLYIARELLKDDGVIFISIDDNEQAQLKLLCDEVFGEENFVTQITWQKKTGASDAKGMATITEYILVYVKSEISLLSFSENEDSFDINRYKYKDEYFELRGQYYIDNLDRGGLQYSDSMNFGIECPDGTITYPNGRTKKTEEGWIWKWSKDKVQWAIEHKFLEFRKSKTKESGWSVCYKNYHLVDNEGEVIDRAAPHKNLILDVLNTHATNELKNIFGSIIFSNPKPTNLVEKLLSFIKFNHGDMVSDFFVGSGTTAHAVMQLNARNNRNIRFICVQLPENLDEALKKSSGKSKTYIQNAIKYLDEQNKPHNLFEITKARIEKAAAKIQADNPDYQGDLGFKIFETVKDFRSLPEFNSDSQQETLYFPDLSHLDDEQIQTLLTTWRVYDGQKLPENIQPIDLAGYNAYLCDKHLYLLHNDFASAHIKALLDKLDEDKTFVIERIVLLGDAIDSAKQQELNQAIKTYANKKSLNISVLVRY